MEGCQGASGVKRREGGKTGKCVSGRQCGKAVCSKRSVCLCAVHPCAPVCLQLCVRLPA